MKKGATDKLLDYLTESEFHKAMQLLAYIADSCEDGIPVGNAFLLMYLIDEKSVRETGVPITKCDYKIFEYGPVPDGINYHVKVKMKFGKSTPLYKYLEYKTRLVRPDVIDVADDFRSVYKEFTKKEFEIIDSIVDNYAGQYKRVIRKDFSDYFIFRKIDELKLIGAFDERGQSDISIDFSELIPDKKLS